MQTMFELPDPLARMVTVAAAAADLTEPDYLWACVQAGLQKHAYHDRLLATAFEVINA